VHFGDSMIPVIRAQSQLLTLPLAGLMVGFTSGLFFYPFLGLNGAKWIAIAVGALLFLGGGYASWRSVFGSTQGLVSSVTVTVMLCALVGGACTALAIGAGSAQAAPWALAAAVSMTLFAFAYSAWRHWRALCKQDGNDPWLIRAVNLKSATVVDVPNSAGSSGPRFWTSPWILGALSVNAMVLFRATGWSELNLMLFVAPILFAASAWVEWTVCGPMLARALYLKKLEHQQAVRLVHQELAVVQALRSKWVVLRWCMPEPTDSVNTETPRAEKSNSLSAGIRQRGKR
jgi:hypothetical protein